MKSASTDTSRISVSAHYTGYIWYKHGLSARGFATQAGRFANATLAPVNALLRVLAGADIDIFLLQRHSVIDHQVKELIEQEGVTQIVELACGLSPRGYRLKKAYPQLRYIEGDLPAMANFSICTVFKSSVNVHVSAGSGLSPMKRFCSLSN